MQVKSIQEAKAAHAALFQEPSVAKAHHVMYTVCPANLQMTVSLEMMMMVNMVPVRCF